MLNKELICEICKGPCKTGMIKLKNKAVICVSCVYEYLGSDSDNGHDWSFSVLHNVAQEMYNKVK